MRAILLCSTLLIQLTTFAQTYSPLIGQKNEWHLGYCQDADCYKDIYFTVGDTIANGKTYKVLDGYHYISKTFWIRENVQEKKVYIKTIRNEAQEETLLYDFNLSVGDSMQLFNPITPFPDEAGFFTVDSIKVQPILGEQTGRFFYFSPSLSNEEAYGLFPIWVEGVGSLSMVNAAAGTPDYDETGQLACFWKDQVLVYHDNSRIESCDSILKTDEQIINQSKIAMTSHKTLWIDQAKNIHRILIYDSQGRLYHDQQLKHAVNIEIDVSNYPKGVYYLNVEENKQTWHKKFLMH